MREPQVDEAAVDQQVFVVVGDFPEAEGDDEIIEEIAALYERLSWGGRDKAAKRILQLYDEWKQFG